MATAATPILPETRRNLDGRQDKMADTTRPASDRTVARRGGGRLDSGPIQNATMENTGVATITSTQNNAEQNQTASNNNPLQSSNARLPQEATMGDNAAARPTNSNASTPDNVERSQTASLSDPSASSTTVQSQRRPADENDQPAHLVVENDDSDEDNSAGSFGVSVAASNAGSGRGSDGAGNGRLAVTNPSECSGSSCSSHTSCSSNLEYPLVRDHFVDAENLRRPDPKNLSTPRVSFDCIKPDETLASLTLTELLERYRKNEDERDRIRQTLLTKKLPVLAEKGNVEELSQVLHVRDNILQNAAANIMEKLLLKHKHWTACQKLALADVNRRLHSESLETKAPPLYSVIGKTQYIRDAIVWEKGEDSAKTDVVLLAVENIHKAWLQMCDDDGQVRVFSNLLYLAVSALLTRCPPPTLEKCSSFIVSSKQQKKQKQANDNAKQARIKAMHHFFDSFKDELGKASSFPTWANMETCARKERTKSPSNCQLIVYAYTLLNEVASHGWSSSSVALLEGIHDLHETSTRTGKHQFPAEVRAAFDFFLVRGFVTLLNTTFKEDMSQVGEQRCDHTKCIADLLDEIIRGVNADEQKYLTKEIRSLAFHSSCDVRKKAISLLEDSNHTMKRLAFSLMEEDLRVAGFQTEESLDNEDVAEENTDNIKPRCAWHTITGTMSDKPVVATVYVPTKADCMAKGKLKTCIATHQASKEQCPKLSQKFAEESAKKERNMNALRRFSHKCPNLLQPIAYKYKPFPYYITEPVENRRLIGYLLKHRAAQRWLDSSVLKHLCQEIVQVATFLADRDTVTRDITAYNMIVDTEDNVYSARGSPSGFLTTTCHVKLADLGLAHEFRNNNALYHDTEIRPVRDQGPIPSRWVAPEALIGGRHTDKSMVYSVGCVMYELWTHGCQPFTSYDTTMSTEEILIKMYSDASSVPLHQWPCIPGDVYSLIKRCTHPDPDQRPSLKDIPAELHKIGRGVETEDPDLDAALGLEDMYPSLSPDQVKRKHVPETGVPAGLQALIDAGKRSELYSNTRKSAWISYGSGVVTDEELYTSDWMKITHRGDSTVVEELVPRTFTQEIKPSLEANELPGIPWLSDKIIQTQGQHVHVEREYPLSVDLQTAARKGWLWETHHDQREEREEDVYDQPDGPRGPKYLVSFASLARSVACLNEQGFCHRDIRAKNVLVNCQTGQATLARIGRMCRMPSAPGSPSFVLGDQFPDSLRWAPKEVLLSGQYSPPSDVFSLATTMYEVFWTREEAQRDPTATERSFAPCNRIRKEQMLDFVRENSALPPVAGCPDWLYCLILDCRHPDPTKRPTARDVLDRLEEQITSGPMLEPFFSHIQSGPDPAAESGELQDETPVLFRRKKKRTKLPRPARYIREKLRARTQKTKSKRKVTVDTSYNPHLTEEETTLKTVEPPSSDNLCAVREGPYAEYKPEDLHASIYQDLCQPSPEKAAKMEEGGPENFEPEARQAAQDASEETRGANGVTSACANTCMHPGNVPYQRLFPREASTSCRPTGMRKKKTVAFYQHPTPCQDNVQQDLLHTELNQHSHRLWRHSEALPRIQFENQQLVGSRRVRSSTKVTELESVLEEKEGCPLYFAREETKGREGEHDSYLEEEDVAGTDGKRDQVCETSIGEEHLQAHAKSFSYSDESNRWSPPSQNHAVGEITDVYDDLPTPPPPPVSTEWHFGQRRSASETPVAVEGKVQSASSFAHHGTSQFSPKRFKPSGRTQPKEADDGYEVPVSTEAQMRKACGSVKGRKKLRDAHSAGAENGAPLDFNTRQGNSPSAVRPKHLEERPQSSHPPAGVCAGSGHNSGVEEISEDDSDDAEYVDDVEEFFGGLPKCDVTAIAPELCSEKKTEDSHVNFSLEETEIADDDNKKAREVPKRAHNTRMTEKCATPAVSTRRGRGQGTASSRHLKERPQSQYHPVGLSASSGRSSALGEIYENDVYVDDIYVGDEEEVYENLSECGVTAVVPGLLSEEKTEACDVNASSRLTEGADDISGRGKTRNVPQTCPQHTHGIRHLEEHPHTEDPRTGVAASYEQNSMEEDIYEIPECGIAPPVPRPSSVEVSYVDAFSSFPHQGAWSEIEDVYEIPDTDEACNTCSPLCAAAPRLNCTAESESVGMPSENDDQDYDGLTCGRPTNAKCFVSSAQWNPQTKSSAQTVVAGNTLAKCRTPTSSPTSDKQVELSMTCRANFRHGNHRNHKELHATDEPAGPDSVSDLGTNTLDEAAMEEMESFYDEIRPSGVVNWRESYNPLYESDLSATSVSDGQIPTVQWVHPVTADVCSLCPRGSGDAEEDDHYDKVLY